MNIPRHSVLPWNRGHHAVTSAEAVVAHPHQEPVALAPVAPPAITLPAPPVAEEVAEVVAEPVASEAVTATAASPAEPVVVKPASGKKSRR